MAVLRESGESLSGAGEPKALERAGRRFRAVEGLDRVASTGVACCQSGVDRSGVDVTNFPDGDPPQQAHIDSTHAMQLIAHRGCADQYPENTVFAAEQSAPHVDAIEIDVRRCATGELVVFHDARLDRLTDRTGEVAETPWSELQTLRIDETPYGIPRLADLLQAVPPDVGLDIELKEPGLVDDVLELIEPSDRAVALTANQAAVVEAIVEGASGQASGFVFWDDPRRGLEAAGRLDCDLIVPEASLCLETDLIETAQARGFDVWVWTVNDPETASKLRRAGADGLIVDRWDVV